MNGIRVIESAWTTDEDTETFRRKFMYPKSHGWKIAEAKY